MSVRKIITATLHATVLTLLTLVWMNLSWEFSDEVIVARINQVVKYLLVGAEDAQVAQFKKNLLLINGSYDKSLIPFEDDRGSGNQPVTDRDKLAKMMALLADAPTPPALVVLDLFLEDPSPHDSILRHHLQRLPAVLISANTNSSGTMNRPWPQLHYGLPYYETTSGMFLKYQLAREEGLHLATAMFAITHGENLWYQFGLLRSANGWWHNTFLLDFPLRRSHIECNELLLWNLGEALALFEPTDIQAIAANRIVIVGDFVKYDNHETLLGEQPGPLIVANAYLALLKETPRLRLTDGMLIFILYFAATIYLLQFRHQRQRLFFERLRAWRGARIVLRYFSYLLLFSIYSILLYLLTNRHFQLFLFALYFQLLEWFTDRHLRVARHRTFEEEKESTHAID